MKKVLTLGSDLNLHRLITHTCMSVKKIYSTPQKLFDFLFQAVMQAPTGTLKLGKGRAVIVSKQQWTRASMFLFTDTLAAYVARYFPPEVTLRCTYEYIPELNHMNVLCVEENSAKKAT